MQNSDFWCQFLCFMPISVDFCQKICKLIFQRYKCILCRNMPHVPLCFRGCPMCYLTAWSDRMLRSAAEPFEKNCFRYEPARFIRRKFTVSGRILILYRLIFTKVYSFDHFNVFILWPACYVNRIKVIQSGNCQKILKIRWFFDNLMKISPEFN